jgi:hypothetical protein
MSEIDPAALRGYVALLSMQRWFARWRTVNRELATRLGVEATAGAPKRTIRASKR